MAKAKPKNCSLLGDSFDVDKGAVYVYRDNGTGRPDGTHIKKYQHGIEREDLERDLSPGMYVVIAKTESGGLERKSVIIEGEPSKTAGLSSFKELMEMKILSDSMNKQQVDPLELVRTIGEVLRPGAPSGSASESIEHFYEGINFGAETASAAPDPASLLAQFGVQQAQQNKETGEIKKLTALMQKTFKVVATKIAMIDQKLNNLQTEIVESTVDKSETGEPERELPDIIKPAGLIVHILEMPADQLIDGELVKSSLSMADKATDGGVSQFLKALGTGAELESYIRAALEARNKGQIVHAVCKHVTEYLTPAESK